MSVKKKLFGVPATVAGIIVGLVLGGLAVLKEVFEKKFPTLGLIILGATPLASFFFEQIISRAFPEAYWEKLAGKLLSAYRFVLNEGFRLRFFYEMRFLEDDRSPAEITPELISQALNAVPGGDPEPTVSGSNYVHLRFQESPYLISVMWHLEQADDEEGESDKNVFRLTMEPEIRDLLMRKAKDDIEGLIARLSRLQDSLLILFKSKPETLAVADAWFGDSRPPATPIREKRLDKTSGGEYRVFPGLFRVTGKDLSALGAIYRHVGTLEEPPEQE